MYKICIKKEMFLLICCIALSSCSFQKEIPATMQMNHNFTIETKLKCHPDWTKTKIYDVSGYRTVEEIFSSPTAQMFYDPEYVKKSIEKYCN